jgi:glutaconyl-CoA decarboxylase
MKYQITLKGKTYEILVERGEAMVLDEYEAKAPVPPAAAAPVAVAAPVAAAPAAAAPAAPAVIAAGTSVDAPLPGNIFAIKVKEGDAVKAGDVLIVIEAMKMENEVCAPSDGVVKQIAVTKGQLVATGDTLVVI